ncbi:hypothetical protein [Spirochaeta africana]|uniref:Uncharacterized protein n=1 Tax=Spirochaeta africana (strain ATCC 700263 / DSM 8902 / Z-7692) TaxID=889378 RepID=H9UKR3_SPIAZ|nr:hypothetical protein [Spirochaeta africana]AFG38106.1 hypothetical protein Spiaf_2058 [Spirochaeta africana DSM 8902]
MSAELLVVACILIFYILIPGAGALHVRRRWRLLRGRLYDASSWQRLRYHDQGSAAQLDVDTVIGVRRMVASVDAVEGDATLWVSSNELSVAIDMSGQDVVLLPGTQDDLLKENSAEVITPPVVVPWRRMFTLSQGTQILVAGTVENENGRLFFRGSRQHPLLILLFEGDPRLVLYRGIWNARQRNEYYNQATPGSLTAGTAGLLLLAYFLLTAADSRLWGLVALTFSFSPMLPLLPPGVLGYFLFRRLWRHGRRLRSERDLINAAIGICNSGSYACREVTVQECDPELPRLHCRGADQGVLLQPQTPDSGDVLQHSLLLPLRPEREVKMLDRLAYRFEAAAVFLFVAGQLATTYVLFVLLSYAV